MNIMKHSVLHKKDAWPCTDAQKIFDSHRMQNTEFNLNLLQKKKNLLWVSLWRPSLWEEWRQQKAPPAVVEV